MNRRGILWIGLLALLVAGFVLVGRGDRNSTNPLDPNGVSGDGLRGVLELARSYGTSVDLGDGLPSAAHTVSLLVADNLSDDARRELRAWVERGGTLVVTDPDSSFAPRRGGAFGTGAGLGEKVSAGQCTVRAVANAPELSLSTTIDSLSDSAVLFRPDSGDARCYTVGPDAFMVVTPRGKGNVVALGSPAPFTNGRLRELDNAVLAVDLLAPVPGTRLAFVRPLLEGRETLASLIRPGVKYGLLQVLIAFLFYALFRARRLGRPIIEDPPIRIASSDLTVAVGNLLARSNAPGSTAHTLRVSARSTLARRLGLPAAATTEQLVSAVGTRSAHSPAALAMLLGDSTVSSDEQLVALASGLHALQQEVLDDRR